MPACLSLRVPVPRLRKWQRPQPGALLRAARLSRGSTRRPSWCASCDGATEVGGAGLASPPTPPPRSGKNAPPRGCRGGSALQPPFGATSDGWTWWRWRSGRRPWLVCGGLSRRQWGWRALGRACSRAHGGGAGPGPPGASTSVPATAAHPASAVRRQRRWDCTSRSWERRRSRSAAESPPASGGIPRRGLGVPSVLVLSQFCSAAAMPALRQGAPRADRSSWGHPHGRARGRRWTQASARLGHGSFGRRGAIAHAQGAWLQRRGAASAHNGSFAFYFGIGNGDKPEYHHWRHGSWRRRQQRGRRPARGERNGGASTG